MTNVETPDGRGGFESAPAVLWRRIPANVDMLPEIYASSAQVGIRSPISVTLRYHSGIKAGQQVIYHGFDGDRTLEIVSPPEIGEKDRMLTLPCRETL